MVVTASKSDRNETAGVPIFRNFISKNIILLVVAFVLCQVQSSYGAQIDLNGVFSFDGSVKDFSQINAHASIYTITKQGRGVDHFSPLLLLSLIW